MAQALNLAAFSRPAPKAEPVAPTKADWNTLDVATLSKDLQSSYFTYKQEQDRANTARKAFEALMRSKLELDDHLDLAFGYRFGQLSVAIVPRERPASRRAALSLEQLIAKAG